MHATKPSPTSVTSAVLRRARQRRSRRGAAFVESILVISALTLGLLSVVFFRDLYEKKLRAMRLARASALAHAMIGCTNDAPRDWIGRDLERFRATTAEQERQPARARNASAPPSAGADDAGRSNRVLGNTGSISSDGEGLLNPITSTGLSGRSSASASGGALSVSRRSVFETDVRSRSFVTCGEEIKESDYDRVLAMVKDEALALFRSR